MTFDPDRWNKVRELFQAALDLAPAERAAFIERNCVDDVGLEQEVTRLLNLSDRAGSFLENMSVRPALHSDESVSSLVLSVGEIVGGRFTIVRPLGRGGMGEVYEAEDAVLRDNVALKVMRSGPGDRNALAAHFRREIQLARRVSHPGVCRVHDVAFHRTTAGEDLIILTMELVRGETLAARLRHGRLPENVALDIARQVTASLEAAHAHHILHRDIKPGNILLEPQPNGAVRAVLTDFGLARTLEPDAAADTRKSLLLGTPEYMAPEQFRGAEASVQSDVYSLGVVLYEMVSGRHPFRDDSRDRGIVGQRAELVVTDFVSGIDPRWADVLRRSLDPDPRNRFPSARDLFEALPTEGNTRRRSAVHRRARIAALLAAIVVAVLAGALAIRWSPTRTPPLTERDTIVLADFLNTTGDAVFDDTLKQGLSMQLRQSPFLNILPDQRLNETLKLMGRTPGAPLTTSLARDACVRTNSKAMFAGSISKLGSQYIVGLRAQDCYSGADLAQEQVTVERKESVLSALDRAAAALRRDVGESLTTVQKYSVPLAQATTPSLEALHAYTLGLRAFREKGDAAAIIFHRRAIELDPQFAMAYVALGSMYSNLGQDGLGRENFEKAYELRDRASELERFRITGDYFTFATGELEKGTLVYEQWAHAYPHDWNPFGRLVLNHMSTGRFEEAATDCLTTMRLFPEGISASVNLMLVYLALNRLPDAKAVYEQTIVRLPNHSRLHAVRYAIAFFEQDVEEMQKQAARTLATPGDEDLQLSYESDTNAYTGRLAAALALSRRAAAIAERNDQKQTAALWLLNAALREAEVGKASRARELRKTALELSSSPDAKVLAALVAARSGDAAVAAALTDDLSKKLPRSTSLQSYWFPTIHASIALTRHDPDSAIELLRAASAYELGTVYPEPQMGATLYPIYVRGQAYLENRHGREAIREFQKILDHRGIVLNFVLGALARLQLGRAKALISDRDGARRAYEEYFALWPDADPDVPILKAARAEYRQLW